jgi:hypothetical protein
MKSSVIVETDTLIEDALAAWEEAIGRSRAAYRGHIYRVFNFSRHLLGTDRADRELAHASAFHDIGIWTDRTFDYLAPSAARARDHLAQRELGVSDAVVAHAIDNHHALRRIRGGPSPDVSDAFRRADLVDLTRGLVPFGLDRGFVRDVLRTFPNQGFHRFLLRTAISWTFSHPLRPLPMLRLEERGG